LPRGNGEFIVIKPAKKNITERSIIFRGAIICLEI